ncbi:hypothetical protein EYF80_032959 [Liparis tanakae]|uniref:Uncharacterized protein n=1 Tax=Liparis tanakae TaxID=230148 RepID=A0A4Z2GVS9_9TELE|nr:hypothetical protein EYF80_032959 [Liparis tanakae]
MDGREDAEGTAGRVEAALTETQRALAFKNKKEKTNSDPLLPTLGSLLYHLLTMLESPRECFGNTCLHTGNTSWS